MSPSTDFGPLATFASSHHGVITRRQAEVIGVGRMSLARLVQRGVLDEFGPGGVLLVAGSPRTWLQRVRAATMLCNEQGIAIGPTAARLLGVDGFDEVELVHIALPGGRRVAMDGVISSDTCATYLRVDRLHVDGIACAGLARTVCDVASLGPTVVERSVDHFLRTGHSLTWLARTVDRLQARGRAGLPLVRVEIERRMIDPALRGSWFEQVVESCLSSPLIPGLQRQFVIRDTGGRFLARVDLAVPHVQFAIEAHSRAFHFGPQREAMDDAREARLVEEGWLVEYLGWHAVRQTPSAVRRHIERVVARRALDLGGARPVV